MGINVCSLFNGMNTGRQALEGVGIKVEKYYSSEIKPYAIELTQFHFPDTIQVGDINKWRDWEIDWSKIDLILSGSPCQDLSAAGKRAGINGSRSSLFFVFVEILNHIKTLNPNVIFFQENVGSASKLDVGIISRALGVYPCRMDSSLLTAQLRDRYYWSNIKTRKTLFDLVVDIPEPKDKKIMLQDILTSGKAITKKHTCLNTGSGSTEKSSQRYLKHRNDTTGMLTLIDENGLFRTVNKIEMCRLQGFPDKEILCNFIFCKKEIIEFVDAVDKNQKLQNIVVNVMDCNNEKDLLEFLSSGKKNMKQKNQQIEHIAVQNVDTLIPKQCDILKKTTHNQKEKNLIVENVEKNILYQNQELEQGFGISNAFINITQEKTTIFGIGEYPQLDKKYTVQSNGKNPLKVCGKEIMQLVENVELTLTQSQVQNLTSIISYRLNQSSIKQMLIIYYWYAKNAIIGFTHQKTQTENLYLNVRIIEGYCDILTTSKAGSLLGDGWTLPIIEHFFSFLPFKKK